MAKSGGKRSLGFGLITSSSELFFNLLRWLRESRCRQEDFSSSSDYNHPESMSLKCCDEEFMLLLRSPHSHLVFLLMISLSPASQTIQCGLMWDKGEKAFSVITFRQKLPWLVGGASFKIQLDSASHWESIFRLRNVMELSAVASSITSWRPSKPSLATIHRHEL